MNAETAERGAILVVDDTPTNLEVLFDLLGNSGFRVLVAEDGESAIEKANYALPDLILLDVLMPGMDGFETCRRLKANEATNTIPIIFLTALTDTVDKVKGFDLGAVDYITKPLQCEEVLARVKTHLRLQNLTKQLQQQNERLAQEIQERQRIEAERQALFDREHQLLIALQESEKKFRLLAENLEAAVWIASNDSTQNFYISPAYERIWQRSCESLRENPRSWLDAIHPDDRDRVAVKLDQQIQGRSNQVEYRIVRSDGSVRWIWDRGFAIQTDSGDVHYFGGIAEDITERKLAEQKIREQADLIDVATDAIVVRDLDHRILFWSRGAERMYGWRSTEVMGQKTTELVCKNTLAQLEVPVQKVIEDGEWQGELRHKTRSNNELIVQSRWTLLRDEAGHPKAILTVSTDITEKKQLEAQFLRAQRLESIGTLASGIAHDLNNILTPILAAAQLLPRKLPHVDEHSRQLLSIMEANAKRGAELVKQVLSFGRGVEGRRTSLQIGHLLSEVEQIIKKTFPKSIEIHTDIPTAQLGLVSADATQLHQVFMNLCVNARDAMPNGGILTISAQNIGVDATKARMHLDAHVGSYVMITIADTGTGIAPEILDRIFDPFFTTKEVGKGTGLGLSTVVGIVKNHGGFVDVTSQVGQGTCFKVYLPTIQGSVALQAESADLLPGQGECVLVVDDEVAIQEIAKAALEEQNYRVLTASDGFEAIQCYVKHQQAINLVLMDLMMPSMDGLTAIRTLKTINPHVKVIATSGLAANPTISDAAAAGVKEFLAKPYTAQDLLSKLRNVLEAKETDCVG